MEFIMENWTILLLGAVVVVNIIIDIVRFKDMPAEEKIKKIKGWLLQAVLLAEKKYGSGTGALKLSAVYAEFCNQLPWLAKTVPFDTFSGYVDEALDKMKELLAENDSISNMIEGDRE